MFMNNIIIVLLAVRICEVSDKRGCAVVTKFEQIIIASVNLTAQYSGQTI